MIAGTEGCVGRYASVLHGMDTQPKVFVKTKISECTAKLVNLTGMDFGILKVVSLAGVDRRGIAYWNYQCKCGKSGMSPAGNLVKHGKKSCGCLGLKNEKRDATTHGMTKTPEWNIWKGARKRCRLKTDPAYGRYGARGIDMCDEWFDSFETFYRDMGPRPGPRMTLERKDNSKGYNKDNCEWATYKAQMRNKRTNHMIEFNGERMCLTEWASKIGIRKDTLRRRIVGLKWPLEKALLP